MKKNVVDNGSYYSFPQPKPYVSLSPGRYYPGWLNNVGFVLWKNKNDEDENEEENDSNKSFAIFSSKGFLAKTEINASEGGSEKTRKRRSKTQEEKDHLDFEKEYKSDRYFPMENYSKGLGEVDESIRSFIKNKEFFEKNGLDYKRSILLFSVPGTGKTWFINHISDELIYSEDAIVINIENSSHLANLSEGMQDIDRTLKNRLKVIVIEELAEFCKDSDLKTKTLQLLDSPFFRSNMLFLVTTNEPESIPQNLIDRPSRLDVLSCIDIDEYNEDFIPDWYQYNTGKKLPKDVFQKEWFQEAKKSLTPVYWAELFKFSELQGINLEQSWEKIKQRKALIRKAFAESKSIGFLG